MGNVIKCPHCGGLLVIDAAIKTEVSVNKIDAPGEAEKPKASLDKPKSP